MLSSVSWRVATLAFASFALLACSDEPKAQTDAGAASAGTSAAGTVAAGAAGTGSGSAGANAAGSGAAAGASAAGSGGTAGMAAVACKINDSLTVSDDDVDGGLPPNCQDIPRTIIAENCIGGICHHSGKFQAPAGRLDLMSPCIADRIINKVSNCQGLVIIDPVNVEKSFLLNKLEAETPICGEPMPWTGHLPPDQVRCMDAWVHAVARAATK